MSVSLTFLLGAGFSEPFGIPTMRPFLYAFREMASKKYPELYRTLERHFAGLGDDSDIEALLSRLGKAERLSETTPLDAQLPEEFAVWQEQSRYLKSHLIAFIIEQCERFDRDLVTRVLAPSLKMLSDREDLKIVNIFTTNYDRIVEFGCEMAALDFSDGFGKVGNELVAPWVRKFDGKVRLYKLHGSVSYYVDQTKNDVGTFLRLDRGYPLPGPDFRLSREGNELEPLMVLPTLDKDALGEPYSHLNHMFTDTMADTLLVIAVGISLRDNHIASAINYNAENVVVLLVDVAPIFPGQRIAGVRNLKLSTDSRTFFESSIFHLMDTIGTCLSDGREEEMFSVVERFASEETARISEAESLTSTQQRALKSMLSSVRHEELFEAVRVLRGVNEDRVVQALAEKSNQGFPTDLRKAVAGCLGYSTNPAAVVSLEKIAKEDSSSDVRLESYLALSAMGSTVALKALDEARMSWPNDLFFS